MTYRDRIARAYSWRYHPALWFLIGVAFSIAVCFGVHALARAV
jgi:hypothetical protein